MSDEAELSTQNQAWNKQQKAIQSQKSMRLTQPLYLGSDNQLDLARERADFLEAEVARLRAVIARKSRTSLVTTVTDLEVEPDAACLSCEGPVVHPFLRVMATDMTEAVPAGTVGDECSICAQKYGRWARRQP